MSILIKGMEMPNSCGFCPFRIKLNPEEIKCKASGKVIEETLDNLISERHENCTLIELPPHGRLIDADALSEHIVYFPMDGGHLPVVYASYLTHASTIIEAEGVE